MPRVGQNPNKAALGDGALNVPVQLAVITHLPNRTTAYHSQRLEVVKACLTTMRMYAGVDHNFIVWDNGSCRALTDWLQYEFIPDILVLSPNIGKNSARYALVNMCNPKSIFCYSDDDMLFFPNWLQPQIDLLKHFPNVASVSGYPVRTAFRWGVTNTLKWSNANGKVTSGKLMPQEWEDDFAVSLGRDVNWHAGYTKDDIDYQVEYKGVSAYCTSHHCQFIGRAGLLSKIIKPDGMAMAGEREFDVAMDEAGLRLSTTQRLCRHMGNVMDEKIKSELMQFA